MGEEHPNQEDQQEGAPKALGAPCGCLAWRQLTTLPVPWRGATAMLPHTRTRLHRQAEVSAEGLTWAEARSPRPWDGGKHAEATSSPLQKQEEPRCEMVGASAGCAAEEETQEVGRTVGL